MNTPKPFKNTGVLRAFVLGCDPTAFSKKDMKDFKEGTKKAEERKAKELKVVFDLRVNETGEWIGDKRYFTGIKANLEALNLKMENIYVQNMVTEFQSYLTSEKPDEWVAEAVKYRDARKVEFDDIDPTNKVPVFLTSYLLYKVLIKPKNGEKLKTAAELYKSGVIAIIPAEDNYLGRPLVPLFRHTAYSSKNEIRKEYFDRVKKELGSHIIKSV